MNRYPEYLSPEAGTVRRVIFISSVSVLLLVSTLRDFFEIFHPKCLNCYSNRKTHSVPKSFDELLYDSNDSTCPASSTGTGDRDDQTILVCICSVYVFCQYALFGTLIVWKTLLELAEKLGITGNAIIFNVNRLLYQHQLRQQQLQEQLEREEAQPMQHRIRFPNIDMDFLVDQDDLQFWLENIMAVEQHFVPNPNPSRRRRFPGDISEEEVSCFMGAGDYKPGVIPTN